MAKLSQEAWGFGMLLFDQFIYTSRMEEAQKKEIIQEADELGAKRAEEIRGIYKTGGAEGILKQLGVVIIRENERRGQERFVRFAEFYPKNKKICLNGAVLDRLGKKMDKKLAREIILCHELYHYFEVFSWGKTSRCFRRKVRLFGKIPVTREILPAAEIAANAFCRTLLRLEFEPQMIEQLYWEKERMENGGDAE